jgi:hypothetical protein
VKISREFPGKYFKASDLNGPVTYAIRDVTREQLRGRNGLEDKPVLWFDGTKQGLPANVTNRRLLVPAFGDDTADWIGLRITLRVERVRGFDGDLVDSIVLDTGGAPKSKRRMPTPEEVAAAAQSPLDDLEDDPIS